jgi:diaminopimelate epimerase
MSLKFWKFTGAGNDFVALDNRDDSIEPDPRARAALIRSLCARGVGVGADGALILEPSQNADFRMRYYNSDGGEAETCGNGARCIARFANMLGAAGPACRFETQAGIYEAVVKPEAVCVSMSDASGLELDVRLGRATLPADLLSGIPSLRGPGTVDFVNTGVPHAVIRVENTEDLLNVPVVELGRAIRYHARFAPAGTNVNFIAPIAPAGTNANFIAPAGTNVNFIAPIAPAGTNVNFIAPAGTNANFIAPIAPAGTNANFIAPAGTNLNSIAPIAPAGTNLNSIAPIAPAGPNHFAIRTYERGVEDETLACGTGSIASAIVACRRGLAAPPVRLTTRSGGDLLVHLEPTDRGATRVRLEGEARLVFKGELP